MRYSAAGTAGAGDLLPAGGSKNEGNRQMARTVPENMGGPVRPTRQRISNTKKEGIMRTNGDQ